MTIETVQIDAISHDPANLRTHSQKNLDAIKASLRRFGQVKPIVVDQRGIVLAGNGTLQAARELGWQEIKIVRTGLAGAEAVAYGIADNRTAELAAWDEVALADVLASLQVEDAALAESSGFTADDIAKLVGSPEDQAPETPPEEFAEFDENLPTEHECPKCKFRWSGSSAPLGGGQ
jgi:ParB-like chromosome segregation protein Spo0J